jgi:hypothetical protein
MPLSKAQTNITFPASDSERYYVPICTGLSAITPIRYTICHTPFTIKKATQSLNLCFEQVVVGTQSINAGIYDGSKGLASASLLFSGTISCTGIGIFTVASTLFFKAGYYIVSGIATSAIPLSSRAFTFNALPNEQFGRPTSDSSLTTNPYYTETGSTDLNATIGTITMSATNAGANIFLRY